MRIISEIKRILFFGLGSIGKRHLQIIQKNYNFELYAYRSQKVKPFPQINNIFNIEEIFDIKPDVAFITNPTHKHVEFALLCLKYDIKNIFIEKPLSHSTKDLDKLVRKMKKINAFIYVAYNMRFNPILIRLRKILDELNERIIYCRTCCASYLPEWRQNQNYQESYSSKKNQGGGVILDLSHEFDYNEWLFGKIKSIEGSYGKISNLEIDSEDFCDVTLRFENGLTGFIHLDYFSRFNERTIKIVSETKEIITDLTNKKIIIKDDNGIDEENFIFEKNDVYKQQISTFFKAIETKSFNVNNLIETKNLLQLLLKFKTENLNLK